MVEIERGGGKLRGRCASMPAIGKRVERGCAHPHFRLQRALIAERENWGPYPSDGNSPSRCIWPGRATTYPLPWAIGSTVTRKIGGNAEPRSNALLRT